jgi:hypothetical protein
MRTRILGLLSSLILASLFLPAQDAKPILSDSQLLWEFDTGG